MEVGMEVVAVAEEEIEGVEVQVHTTEVGEEDQGPLCTGEEGVHLRIMEEETTEVAAEATLLEDENILPEDTNQIKKSALNVYNNKSHFNNNVCFEYCVLLHIFLNLNLN